MIENEVRLAMFISGGGTTMEAIGKACKFGELKGLVKPVLVVSSSPNAGGIKKAEELHIPVEIVERSRFPKGSSGQKEFGKEILRILSKYSPDVITQNGWLPLTPENVIYKFRENIFNQHPGPVPDFGGQGMYGRRVHAAVIIFNRLVQRQEPYTLMIAQRVHPNFDEGEMVKCEKVTILPEDTVEDLQGRSLPIEHVVQISLLRDIATGVLIKGIEDKQYVRPEEREILFLAKEAGKALYPHG